MKTLQNKLSNLFPQDLTDGELIVFLKEGDPAAYTEIYNRYFQLMFTFVYKKVRDEELAKDFVQDLFIKLWERREKLGQVSSFSSYMFVTLRNNILNHFKHQQVGQKYIDFLAGYAEANRSSEADFKLREQQLAEYIELQVQRLPKKMRKIFEMSRKLHLSHKEIALALGTSENNVKTQIMNALRIIRAKVGKGFMLIFFL